MSGNIGTDLIRSPQLIERNLIFVRKFAEADFNAEIASGLGL
jgi:hypothetical protein